MAYKSVLVRQFLSIVLLARQNRMVVVYKRTIDCWVIIVDPSCHRSNHPQVARLD